MTIKEAIFTIDNRYGIMNYGETKQLGEALDMAIEALKAQPCEDAMSRQAVLDVINNPLNIRLEKIIGELPSVTPKQRLCKDCKWWKDSDGVYRRDTKTKSQCPINRKEVFEGNGYCYMFESYKAESEK